MRGGIDISNKEFGCHGSPSTALSSNAGLYASAETTRDIRASTRRATRCLPKVTCSQVSPALKMPRGPSGMLVLLTMRSSIVFPTMLVCTS
jgi:hypothetical protein